MSIGKRFIGLLVWAGGACAMDSYPPEVHAVLQKHCAGCHNPGAKQGGLDLSTPQALLRGGDRGPGFVRGNAKESLLYQMVTHQRQPAMPYKGSKLPDDLVQRLGAWIDSGAPLTPAAPAAATAILARQCLQCHGGKFKQAGLSLITREALLKGSDNGPVVTPGHADDSLLVKKIRHEHQPGMPFQAAKLPKSDIDRIVEWVNVGAPYEGPLKIPEATLSAAPAPKHWAFERPKAAPIPQVKNQTWVRTPIDSFILSVLEQKGLTPLPEADKRTLIRRVYLDLIGLPPTTAEIGTFLADPSKNAYEKVVDRLLENPHYGERWGRHWMDIWRYSDLSGASETDPRNSQPFMWRWRDWIVESLNQDKGYDRMLMEMVAGDELEPADPKVLRATGYLARNWVRYSRTAWLQDTVESTAAGFLGVTLRCARCHDHKFDPIAQEEYYRVRAIFEPHDVRVDRLPGVPDIRKDGVARVFDSEPRPAPKDPNEPANDLAPPIFGQTFRFIRGDEKTPDKEMQITPGVLSALGAGDLKIEPVKLPLESFYPDLKDSVRLDLLGLAKEEIARSEAALEDAKQGVEEARRATATPVEIKAIPRDTFNEVRAILKNNCFACHHTNVQESGLKLGTVDGLLEGGRLHGPAIVPGASAKSPLIWYLRGERKPSMPLNRERIPEKDIARLAKWIDGLPPADPKLILEKAEARVLIAEKERAAAVADVPAIEARYKAEFAKYASPPAPNSEELAAAAKKAEREAALLHAEARLLRAQRKVIDAIRSRDLQGDYRTTETQDNKIEAARKELASAQADLAKGESSYSPVGKVYAPTSTGRRLALARWLAARQNPLTARVAVNHIWLRHFGKALVPTVANFGRSGKPPVNPVLLDWLAVKFMENGWSMKALHRMILTSSVYRMRSSAEDPKHANISLDPDNQFLWRMNPRRMEGEIVRDSILHVAGQLDLTMGGPELDEKKGQEILRRSLYFIQTPFKQMALLKIFDGADPNGCYQRGETIMPQQALVLANSKLALGQARLLAARLGDSDFVGAAFEMVLGRFPTPDEKDLANKFLENQSAMFAGMPSIENPVLRARANLVHVLLNHPDFVTIR